VKLALVLTAALAAGCSSNPSIEDSGNARIAANADAEKGVICRYERPTYTSLKEKRCTTAAERDDQQLAEEARRGSSNGNVFGSVGEPFAPIYGQPSLVSR